MSLKTALIASALSIPDIISALPLMLSWRNSKGRIMPMHIKSPPGAGKTMLAEMAARAMARQMPGVPVGLAVSNVGNASPSDVPGYVVFDTIKTASGGTEKVSTYSRPAIFQVQRALTFAPGDAAADSQGFVESFFDDDGQTMYVGCTVRGQRLDNGIMLFDEFDQADVETRKVCAPLLDEGRITNHHLPVGWAVWAMSNRAQDASGTGRGLAFLTNRVCSLELKPDHDGASLLGYLQGQSIYDSVEPLNPSMLPVLDSRGRIQRNAANVDTSAHPAGLAYASENLETIYAGVPSDPNTPFLTARSLEAMLNLFDVSLRLSVADESGAMDGSLSFADSFVGRHDADDIDGLTGDTTTRWRVFQALAAGTVGGDNAAQFCATLELFDEVPTLAQIIHDPKGARVSEKRDAQFIVAYQIANGMTRKNADALMTYGKRLDTALYHNIPHNAVSRDGELLMAASIAKFFNENTASLTRMMMMRHKAAAAQTRNTR